jgi:hypothetical protein
MIRNRRTSKSALILGAPALLLFAAPTLASVPVLELESPLATAQDEDPPKPRTIPKPAPKVKPQEAPKPSGKKNPERAKDVKDQQRKARAQGGGAGKSLPALDSTDPDYKRKAEKYARYGYGPDGQPLPGGAPGKGNPGKGKPGVGQTADQLKAAAKGSAGVKQPGKAQSSLPKDPNALLDIPFGSDRHDFGRAEQGDVLNHVFEFRAGGSSPLIIGQASPTCGCTIGLLEIQGADGEFIPYVYGDPIPSGGVMRLNARMNTTNKRNRTEVKINVYHNDPRGTTQLALVAHVEPFLQATPPLVNFGNVPGGESKTQVFNVHSNKGEPVSLTWDALRGQRKPDGLNITVEAVNAGPDGKASHWRVTCSTDSSMKEGNFGYQISLLSDKIRPDAEEIDDRNNERAALPDTNPDGTKNPKHVQDTNHRLNVTCTGRVLGLLSHNPQFVSMGVVRPGQVVPRTVRVDVHDQTVDLTNLVVELKGDPNSGEALQWAEHFTTEVRPVPGSKSVDVEIKLNGLPDDAEGAFRGVISIQTGVPAKPEIIVRFSGVCRGSATGGR